MDNDISGLEFVVSSKNINEDGDWEGSIKLKEDEWYPAILTQFVPYKSVWENKEIKQIRWVFELQGEEFSWKSKDGKKGQMKTSFSTSYACSPKSKLYKAYTKLTGKEDLAEGEKISLAPLLNMSCFVMLKKSKGKNGKTWYNVDKMKQGDGSVKKEEKKEVKNPPSIPTTEEIKEAKPGSGDIFEDIF